jgi:hypothetical protein
VIWLLLLLASSAAAEDGCRTAYKSDYAEQWELSRTSWNLACEQKREVAEILRSGQRDFQRACERTFASRVTGGLQNKASVTALCAQGISGRNRLEQKYLPPKPVRAAPPPEVEPAESGMGPMTLAINTAHKTWGNDLCLSAMVYFIGPKTLKKERNPGKDGTLISYEDHLESYRYYFHSRQKWEDTYEIRFEDRIDRAFKILKGRLDGPEPIVARKLTGKDCLKKVNTEPKVAVDVALKHGALSSMDDPLIVYLASEDTWKESYTRCLRGLRKGMRLWCKGKLRGWQEKRLRSKELWVVNTPGRSTFVDAETGSYLFFSRAKFEPVRIAPSDFP